VTTGTSKKGGGLKLALLVVGGFFGLLCGVGILAAVAIPAVLGYIKRSKTAEAPANLALIYSGVQSYAQTERIGQAPGLPPSLPATPQQVPCGDSRQLWPAGAHPAWADLGFAPADPLYYSYSLEVDPNGRDFTIRAHGDLDCDGVTSRYELGGHFDPATGEVTREPDLVITDELE